MNGVEITPRVDTVAAWHDASLSLAAAGTAGERRMIPNRSRSVEADGDSLEPLPPRRPGLADDALAVQLEEVERGEGHGAPRPVARLEHGLDALAAVAGHGLAVQHGRRDRPADLAQPGEPGSRISSRPGRLKAWTVRCSRTWSCARWPSSLGSAL